MKKLPVILVTVFIIVFIVGVIAEETRCFDVFKITINCNSLKEKIEKENNQRLVDFENKLTMIKNSKKSLYDFITLAKKSNYDVSILEEKLSIFNIKFEKFKSDYYIYLNLIGELKDNACNKDNFDKATKNMDLQFGILIKDSDDIKSYSNEITVEINKLVKDIDNKNSPNQQQISLNNLIKI
jgi:hypothetical protein